MTKNKRRQLSDPVVVPYLRVANVQDGYLDLTEIKTIHIERSDLGRFSLRPGDVLMNEGGDIDKLGRGAVWHGELDPCVHQNHVFSVRCDARSLWPDFLAAVAESHIGKSYFLRVGKQTTNLASINKTVLRGMPVPLPPLPEQRRIAEILDTLDEAIRKTEQVISKLQQMKQGLLHDLLTRGIDEHGELRDPERHPEQFKDSPLGRIPRGWVVARLRDIVSSAVDGPFGSSLKSSHYVEHGVRVVRLQNIGTGEFNDGDRAFVSRRHAATLSRHEVCPGDLLVASLGDERHPIARACLYPEGHPSGIVKADCFRLRPDETRAISGFLMMALICPATRRDIFGLAQGVTRDRINLGNLMGVRVPIAPVEEQLLALERWWALGERVESERQQSEKLRTLKQGLMDDLLTGRVRVLRPR